MGSSVFSVADLTLGDIKTEVWLVTGVIIGVRTVEGLIAAILFGGIAIWQRIITAGL